MPTYRVLDQDGVVVDKEAHSPDISDEEAIRLYKDMVTVSVMDIIMFDAQRQGRVSFYMVSAGEEGIAVGSASALSPEDPLFAQYRETGIFQHRGFTMDDFMAQLFATKNDPGKGEKHAGALWINEVQSAHHLVASSNTDTASERSSIRSEDAGSSEPDDQATSRGMLLRRRCGK